MNYNFSSSIVKFRCHFCDRVSYWALQFIIVGWQGQGYCANYISQY